MTIVLSPASLIGFPQLRMRIPGLSRIVFQGASLLLALPASAAMLIDGYDPAFNDRFANDPSFIAAGYDLSGLARSPSNKWGTLVSPNVFLASTHWHPDNGNILTFFETNDPSGPSTTRTVIGGQRIGLSDIWIGILDQSLPSGHTPFPFLDEPIANATQFENSSLFDAEVFMVGRSNDDGSSVTNIAFGRNILDRWEQEITQGSTTDSALEAIYQIPSDSGYTPFESFLVLYDSSAPVLRDIGGQLTIVGLNWYIQGDVDVNPKPPLTLRDISGFAYVGNYAPLIQGVINAFVIDATAGYIAWAPTAFGGVTDLAQTGPAIDFDGDGLSNFLEYAFALNPNSGANPVPASVATVEAGESTYLEAAFSLRTDPYLLYSVRLGSDLLGWTDVDLSFSGGAWAAADPALVEIVSQDDLGSGVWALSVRAAAALVPGIPRLLALQVIVAP